VLLPRLVSIAPKDNIGWAGWEEFRNLAPMIKLTYKSRSRSKTTEKQASPFAQSETKSLVDVMPDLYGAG
jgi:type 1 glutamine amidotransferase